MRREQTMVSRAGPPLVALAACADYNPGRLEASLRRLMVPSFASLVTGRRILLKPNLLTDSRPDQAVTTHPEFVRAVIRWLRQLGVQPVMADSPASAVKLQQVWDATGFAALSREENIPLLNLEKAGSVRVECGGYSFHLSRLVSEIDLIINLPKVKTHTLTTLTCGVKNLYGLVPGYMKAQLHKMFPKPEAFGGLLSAIYQSLPPCLTIADGIVGMEGDGPSGGSPVHLGLMAAADDAVALDLALCRILNIPPSSVPYLKDESAHPRYQGMQITGDDIQPLPPGSFKLPRTMPVRLVPGWFLRSLSPLVWVRPVFQQGCVACGRCVEACPVKALQLASGAAQPKLAGRKCIGCCCCHEICPVRAIEMRSSPIMRLGAWLRR